MKPGTIKIGYLLLIGLSGWVFALGKPLPAEERAVEPPKPEEVSRVTAGNTEFALDLYHHLAGRPDSEGPAENVFFSPYSISTALAMVVAGARGPTEVQMRETLRFFEPQETFHAAFGRLEQRLNEQGQKGDYELAVANALWMQKEHAFLDAFLEVNRRHYSAKLERVDFRSHAERVRKQINGWVEQKTRDRIKDLIPPGMLDAMTRLVLTNAIYFKGDWADPFDKAMTRQEHFYCSPEKTVTAPLMHRRADYKYGESVSRRYAQEIKIQVLELPYKGDDVSMVVLLPESHFLRHLEEDLSAETLKAWTSDLKTTEVDVFLPKFTMTYQCELGRVLAAMGMPQAFGSAADFSGMTGSRDLFISNVIHKAFVAVDEEGTEAAAATGIVRRLTAVRQPPPMFRADRPFLFLIRDKETGSVLFMGRVTDPTKE